MVLIPGVNVKTLLPTEKIIENIKVNSTKGYHPFTRSSWWRNQVPIALIGGGPSLRKTWRELLGFRYTMVAGSAHDFLMSLGITPTWCIIVDGDPIVNKYMTRLNANTHYLVASQCAPETFEYLKEARVPFSIWHADCHNLADKKGIFAEGTRLVSGGCTVGTRAMIMAVGMGFHDQHLFGYDTCLTNDYKHHAYDFVDPDNETLGTIYEIRLGGPNGPKYKVAEYMLAQIVDFQYILRSFANCLHVTVHGEGLLHALMAHAQEAAVAEMEQRQKTADEIQASHISKVLENGDFKRLDQPGDGPPAGV